MVTESIAPAISGRASSRAFPVLGAAGRVGWYSHRPSAGEPFEPDAIDWSGMRALSEWPTIHPKPWVKVPGMPFNRPIMMPARV